MRGNIQESEWDQEKAGAVRRCLGCQHDGLELNTAAQEREREQRGMVKPRSRHRKSTRFSVSKVGHDCCRLLGP